MLILQFSSVNKSIKVFYIFIYSQVGDKVVSLSRNQNGVKQIVTSAVRLTSRNRPDNTSVLRRVEQCARKPLDKDLNINGRRGALPHRRTNSAEGSVKADNTVKDDPMPGPSTSGLSLGKQIVTSPSLDSMDERRMQAYGETAKRQIENNNPVIPPKSFSNKDVPVRRKTSPLNKVSAKIFSSIYVIIYRFYFQG